MDTVTSIVLPFLLPYLKLLVAALIVGFFTVSIVLLPFFVMYLKKLAEKIGAEKVRVRIQDAIDKLNMIVRNLLDGCSVLYRKEILEALKDGKLEDAEVKAISQKLANEALKIISPEIDTFKKYLTGEAVFDYVVSVVNSMLVKWANEIMKKQNPTSNPNQG